MRKLLLTTLIVLLATSQVHAASVRDIKVMKAAHAMGIDYVSPDWVKESGCLHDKAYTITGKASKCGVKWLTKIKSAKKWRTKGTNISSGTNTKWLGAFRSFKSAGDVGSIVGSIVGVII